MVTRFEYRVASFVGAIVLTATAVLVANVESVQWAVTTFVPFVNRLDGLVLTTDELLPALVTAVAFVTGLLIPLYRPRPRRILNTIALASRRILVAGLALAAVGYFDYTYRLPRSTLLVTLGLSLLTIPTWFVIIRQHPQSDNGAIIVGDDPEQFKNVVDLIDIPILGFVSSTPSDSFESGEKRLSSEDWVGDQESVSVTDGGESPEDRPPERFVAGLSRLEDAIIDRNIDTAILAFSHPDRGDFFGALGICHEHGVDVKVLREHAATVLISEDRIESDQFVDIDLEPWDWQDRLLKRAFDIVFSSLGLILVSPVMILAAIAIRLDSDGPILYSQKRTAEFGDTFEVYKFRTMVVEPEDPEPIEDEENDRITRVGRFLRRTHLDEIPQLWSILSGDMSTVGPRAAWVDEESHIEDQVDAWRQRWFVKPGLTGLAQINQTTSENPEEKLQYDLAYIRRQSFWYDVKIVIRQLWTVLQDLWSLLKKNSRI